MRLELDTDATAYAPGETVRGTVTSPDGGAVRAVVVTLELREHGGSFDAVAWTAQAPLADQGELPAGWRAPFALAIPAGALPSVRSPNGGLAWSVRARADVRGRDAGAEATITVGLRPAADGTT